MLQGRFLRAHVAQAILKEDWFDWRLPSPREHRMNEEKRTKLEGVDPEECPAQAAHRQFS